MCCQKGEKNWKFEKALTHDSLSLLWIQCVIKGLFVKLIIGVTEVKRHNESLSYSSRVKWPFHSTPWPLEFTTSIYFLSILPFHALPWFGHKKPSIVHTHCKDWIILARLKHPYWMSIDSLLGKAGRGLEEMPDIWHPQPKATSELTIITRQGFLGMESSSLNQRTAWTAQWAELQTLNMRVLSFQLHIFNACQITQSQ